MKLTRHDVATWLADSLPSNRGEATLEAAAWLSSTGRRRQARYLASDVAQILAGRGYLYVRLTTARSLSPAGLKAVTDYINRETGARELEIETLVEPNLIGGVRIETPSAQLDATVKARLAQFVRGVR